MDEVREWRSRVVTHRAVVAEANRAVVSWLTEKRVTRSIDLWHDPCRPLCVSSASLSTPFSESRKRRDQDSDVDSIDGEKVIIREEEEEKKMWKEDQYQKGFFKNKPNATQLNYSYIRGQVWYEK